MMDVMTQYQLGLMQEEQQLAQSMQSYSQAQQIAQAMQSSPIDDMVKTASNGLNQLGDLSINILTQNFD